MGYMRHHAIIVTASLPEDAKEWWAASDQGDAAREELRDWLRASIRYYSWAEVQYGDEDGDQHLVAAS